MKTNRNKGWLIVLAVVLVAIGLTWGICKGQEKTWNYQQNGDEVICEVVQVVRVGSTDDVTVQYRKSDHSIVKAHCIANKKDVSVGDTLTGYVLPEQPDEVLCPASASLTYLMFGIIGFVWLVAIVSAVLVLKSNQFNRQLTTEGRYATGKVLSVQRMERVCFAKILFLDENGIERVTEVVFQHETPRPGQACDVIYLIDKKGKCHAKLAGS